MEKDYAIEIKNLSKTYKVYRHPSDLLKEIIFRRPFHENFDALKNINLKIKRGEVVGVIGRNGSGKSTLLKILAGTLDKTEGEVKVDGRVSAILDLGLGFNPEYTGRENIYNGALVLGMSKKEIEKKLPKIIEFSELEEFIDRPFKTYSAGMQARLTFSVASEIEPDILVIDEALAAGDMFFMTKCMNKITQMCQSGATVLLVSHSLPTVRKLCQRAIYLDHGKIIQDGPADFVCNTYENSVMKELSQKLKQENVNYSPVKKIWKKKGPIDIARVQILDSKGKETYTFRQYDKLTFRIYYKATKPLKNISAWVVFFRSDGVPAMSFVSCIPYIDLGTLKDEGYIDITWDEIYLGEAEYLISCGLYPYKRKKPLGSLPLESYVWHDKRYKLKIYARYWPTITVYDQPAKIKNFPFQSGRNKK